MLLFIPSGKLLSEQQAGSEPSVKLTEMMGIIARDKTFIAALLCSILCSVVFIHYEAILPQYLLLLDGNGAVKLITMILVTNACTVLVFQTFIVRFMAQINLPKRILLGGMIFALSQLCFFCPALNGNLAVADGHWHLQPGGSDSYAEPEHSARSAGAGQASRRLPGRLNADDAGDRCRPLDRRRDAGVDRRGRLYLHRLTQPDAVRHYFRLQAHYSEPSAGYITSAGERSGPA
ncbi:hypothetical protein OJE16_17680 [Pantoea tagorei]